MRRGHKGWGEPQWRSTQTKGYMEKETRAEAAADRSRWLRRRQGGSSPQLSLLPTHLRQCRPLQATQSHRARHSDAAAHLCQASRAPCRVEESRPGGEAAPAGGSLSSALHFFTSRSVPRIQTVGPEHQCKRKEWKETVLK